MEDTFLDILHKRYACKRFNNSKKVSEQDRDYILEAGRLSPSSIGLEHWKFLVIEDEQKKADIQAGCWNQPQVGTASFIVILLGKLVELEPDHPYVQERLRALTHGDDEAYSSIYNFYSGYFKSIDLPRWSSEQCHIAATNMMNAAAFKGIDSCPIGGFEEQRIKHALNISSDYIVSLITVFGYAADTFKPKNRLSLEQLVEYM